jgi:hypothetical protein
MIMPYKFLSAAFIASSAALLAQPANAAPLSSTLALQNASSGQIETVQWRRGDRRGWIGPAAGVAAGLAIGGAIASRPYYYGDYGYTDGYVSYGYAPVEPYAAYRFRGWSGSGRPGCTQENREDNPMCQ